MMLSTSDLWKASWNHIELFFPYEKGTVTITTDILKQQTEFLIQLDHSIKVYAYSKADYRRRSLQHWVCSFLKIKAMILLNNSKRIILKVKGKQILCLKH